MNELISYELFFKKKHADKNISNQTIGGGHFEPVTTALVPDKTRQIEHTHTQVFFW